MKLSRSALNALRRPSVATLTAPALMVSSSLASNAVAWALGLQNTFAWVSKGVGASARRRAQRLGGAARRSTRARQRERRRRPPWTHEHMALRATGDVRRDLRAPTLCGARGACQPHLEEVDAACGRVPLELHLQHVQPGAKKRRRQGQTGVGGGPSVDRRRRRAQGCSADSLAERGAGAATCARAALRASNTHTAVVPAGLALPLTCVGAPPSASPQTGADCGVEGIVTCKGPRCQQRDAIWEALGQGPGWRLVAAAPPAHAFRR